MNDYANGTVGSQSTYSNFNDKQAHKKVLTIHSRNFQFLFDLFLTVCW